MKSKNTIVGIVVVGLGVGVIGALLWRPRDRPTYQGRDIPKEGLVLNVAGRTHLGDPQNAVVDFKRIYAAMDGYRRSRGTLPPLQKLLGDPGGLGLTAEDLSNPDAQYADAYVSGQKNLSSYMFAYLQPRPDGKPKPAFPAAGEKDAWLVSTDYVRRNQTVYQDQHQDLDFKGAYVVLWSDGTVEKVPILKGLYAKADVGSVLDFKGQAGLPDDSKGLKDIYKEASPRHRITYDGKPRE